MNTALRFGAAAIAAVTALLLVIGDHPVEFVVADLLVVVLLVVAAVLPAGLALMGLAIAFGVGLGVFTVAFAASVDSGATNWAVASAVFACLLGITLALREATVRRTEGRFTPPSAR